MKKYLVSLGCNEPVNWEIELEAKNQREAIREARDRFYSAPSDGDFVETGMGAELMGSKAIHVEEV